MLTFDDYKAKILSLIHILQLIDTFSACTGEKPGRYLIPYFSGFCPAWTIREHYYDTKK